MRLMFLAALLCTIDWMAFRAIHPFLTASGDWSPVLQGLYWAIPVLGMGFVIFAFRGWNTGLSTKAYTMVTALIVILYLSKLLTGTFVLLDDVRRLGAWIMNGLIPGSPFHTARMPLMSRVGILVGSVPAVLLVYGLIRNPYRYKVMREDIFLEIPPALDGLRIVQISDIHAGSLLATERVLKSVDMINALDPDVVCFTGDLVNHAADEVDDLIEVFGMIRARYGVYSVVGNHDYGDYRRWPDAGAKKANFEKLKLQHARMGWKLLLNAHHVIRIGDASVSLIGVENYSAHPRFRKYGDMSVATAGMKEHDLTILMSHDPSHWDAEVRTNYPYVDLTLSGHTHGFQFGIEYGRTLKWSPVQYFYRRWAGLYREGKQYLYVNRGLGFLGYPGRVGILPEITLLTLRRDHSIR